MLLFANRIIVFYRENESCVALYNLDCKEIKKMTFKKEDPTILSLYFVHKEGEVFLLRIKLDNSKDFLEDLQIMMEDNAQ